MYYCDDLEIKAVENVLKKRKLFRYQGPNIDTECSIFENKFAAFIGSKKSILLSSGTNALVNALFCSGVSEGDEVLIPSYTFFATAAAILELKAIPVVVNIDSHLSFHQEELIQKITNKTKALIAVHMDGFSCDMDFLINFCRSNDLKLIEDCAQSTGGSYKKQQLGSIGDFGCFSFNEDKIISCGEGGAICINNLDDYQKSFLYHDTCNQFGITHRNTYTIEKFSGKSMRVSEIQGALINVQLDRINNILTELRIRKNVLDNHFKNLGFNHVHVFDSNGECGTTSRFHFQNAEDVKKAILELGKLGIRSISPTLRPAHNVWQWQSLLTHPASRNKFDFLPSIDILSTVLLVNITLEDTLENWSNKIKKINFTK